MLGRSAAITRDVEDQLIRVIVTRGTLNWNSVEIFGRVAAGGWNDIMDEWARLGHHHTRDTLTNRWTLIKQRLLRALRTRGIQSFTDQQRQNPNWLVATLAGLRIPGLNALRPGQQQPQQQQQRQPQAGPSAPRPVVQQVVQLPPIQQQLPLPQGQIQLPEIPVAVHAPIPRPEDLPENYLTHGQYPEMYGSPQGSTSSSMMNQPPGLLSTAPSPSPHNAPMANLLAVVDQSTRANDISYSDFQDMDESQRNAARLTLQRMAERMSAQQQGGGLNDYTLRLMTSELQQQWSQLRNASLAAGDRHAYDNLGQQPGRLPNRRPLPTLENRRPIPPPPNRGSGSGGSGSGGSSSLGKGKGVDRG